MTTKFGRIATLAAQTTYQSDGVAFSRRDWTPFDPDAHPTIATDPHLEIVSTPPALVDDRKASNDELRDGLRAALARIATLEAQ
jgi:hypothetical protein